jgi:hypothetical protein
MNADFDSFDLDKIKLVYFEEQGIRAVLKDDQTVVFRFSSREEMESAIERWSKHRWRNQNPN